MDYISLEELCEKLSVSAATARNWIRLRKITPAYTDRKTPYFSEKYAETLRAELQSGKNKALKSRRNKTFVSGNSLYNSYVSKQCQNIPAVQKLLSSASEEKINFDDAAIQLLIADCALHLFLNKAGRPMTDPGNLLLQFLHNDLSTGEYDCLITDLIEDKEAAEIFCQEHPSFFRPGYLYEANEDILGLIYISCKNIGNRKAAGSYYTSAKIVKKLIGRLDFHEPSKILDPCCGTGNFLLQLPEQITFDWVYGNDIDSAGVKITRINMALKYNAPAASIYEHITESDFLTEYDTRDFQYIIGNPPWGYEFSETEKSKLRTVFRSASGKNTESYDFFIEQALKHLADNGRLAYVLPEAVLNVKAHRAIREMILENCSVKNLVYLGNMFDKVQCPCIILDLQYTHSALLTSGMNVETGTKSFTINSEREVTPERFSFAVTDEEYHLLNKIRNVENASFLRGNADFALGIVTGNNAEYISGIKTDENEMILKGSDISRYHISPAHNYITFKPENFQQAAPAEIYRAPEKLLYRFVSSHPVFAYDDKQTLSLNSCNIVIPRIPGAKMKYVLAILNSGIVRFFCKKEFNSVKVLRSHIESIPIPSADYDTQDKIIGLVDKLTSGCESTEAEKIYAELDLLIAEIFNLNADEAELIKKV